MTKHTLPLLWTFFSCLLLCSCSSIQPGDIKQAACNELKSQIVFTGSTSNIRAADIQRSEQLLNQHNYDINQCR